MSGESSPRRRFWAPEVIQSSAMDCGPASLKAILGGFGISVAYGRLREACSTDVDGTSIDTLEDVAVELGLDAQQAMVPFDHVALPEAHATPCILTVQARHGPGHFVVLWRIHGGFAQIMDPSAGRRWITVRALEREILRHAMPVDAEAWREWAGEDAFRRPLLRRLRRLGVPAAPARALLERALADASWRTLGALDAAIRMLTQIGRRTRLGTGSELAHLIERLVAEDAASSSIPEAFWCVRPTSPGPDGEERILFRGAVLVHVAGPVGERRETEAAEKLAPELLQALKAPTRTTWEPFTRALAHAGGVAPALVAGGALAVASVTVLAQAILLRSAFDLGMWLGIGEHRLGAFAALAVFLVAALALDLPLQLALQRLGRRIEVLMRLVFARKVPRTADRYFHSRLTSDLAERAHALTVLRGLPGLVSGWLRSAFQLVLTAAGLLWLAPWLTGWVVATVVLSIALSMLSVAVLQEREMRARSHGSALMRFYFDALLGVAAIRAHGAGASLARQQEGMLVAWSGAQRRLDAAALAVDGAQGVVGAALAIGLVMTHVAREGTTATILLVTYWALQLPALAQALAASARQLPGVRNVLVRILEPLSAPEETDGAEGFVPTAAPDVVPLVGFEEQGDPTTMWRPPAAALMVADPRLQGVRIDMRAVTVRAGGHEILHGVDLDVEAGSQVAIVGRSGSGKSSLLGLLLGWHRPVAGEVRLDGEVLTRHDLPAWRRRTAWVDPAVQLFNRRFVRNLLYGAEEGALDVPRAIEEADLRDVLERLPDGLQTVLGEGGALVSGGEGQRVRLGRAWLRRDVRLVLLDEPFRGLDREQRHRLSERARKHWAGATMLCVTHDLEETLGFDRVLVVDGGRIVEDGDPRVLARDERTRFHAMLAAEHFLTGSFWTSAHWRRVRVENGTVTERAPAAPGSPQLARGGEERSPGA